MRTPEALEFGISFDLGVVERELQAEEPFQRDGHTARTLVRAPDLRVLLIVIKAGHRIAEHHVNDTASLQALSGHLRLHLPDRIVELPAGQLVALGSGLRHDVEATTDSAFILTLAWHDKK